MKTVTPFLTFNNQAIEAVKFYTSLFDDSQILSDTHYVDDEHEVQGEQIIIDFKMNGQHYTAMNGGEHFQFSDAFSFCVACETQTEIDELWEQLTTNGGTEVMCGWLKDAFGVSWQIVPANMGKYFGGTPEQSARVQKAILGSKKIVIAELEAAFNG